MISGGSNLYIHIRRELFRWQLKYSDMSHGFSWHCRKARQSTRALVFVKSKLSCALTKLHNVKMPSKRILNNQYLILQDDLEIVHKVLKLVSHAYLQNNTHGKFHEQISCKHV